MFSGDRSTKAQGTKRKKRVEGVRHRWTTAELKELQQLFAVCFRDDRTPREAEIQTAMKRSESKGGSIWKLKIGVIKSKVSWMRHHSHPSK